MLRTDSLVASFDGNFIIAKVGDIEQISNVSINNFNTPITYTLYDKNGNISKLTLLVTGYNGLPRVEINTEDGSPINSKQEYVNAKIYIGNSPINGILDSSCRIKGRGHYTWSGYPKKPYHLKLNEKESVLGFPSNKDWILLAEYTDRSLLRTAYMFGLSEAVQMDWTPKYQHVELKDNFVKWPVLGQFYSAILVSFDNWEDETKYCISFLTNDLRGLMIIYPN